MRNRYVELSELEASIPLFSRPWWLDAVAGERSWDVVLVERDGVLHASMPFVFTHRYGHRFISQPILTQHLGPWLRAGGAKYAKELARQKDLCEELIRQLPRYDHFFQNFHHQQTNWLPFFWQGFKQTTRYTYVLPDLSDEKKIWDGFQANIRTDIKKASNRFGVKVRAGLCIREFFALNSLVFKRQGMAMPYDLAQIERLDQACAKRGCRRIFIAEDAEGRPHAAVYVVWDEKSAYYLMGGGDPELRNSGATSLCMWEAVRFAATVTQRFDLEGSMLEPVERFFRGFGAVQVPYSSLSRTPSRLLQCVQFARTLIKS
jgi:hypothetical protein